MKEEWQGNDTKLDQTRAKLFAHGDGQLATLSKFEYFSKLRLDQGVVLICFLGYMGGILNPWKQVYTQAPQFGWQFHVHSAWITINFEDDAVIIVIACIWK
jgi:hypothetical protein